MSTTTNNPSEQVHKKSGSKLKGVHSSLLVSLPIKRSGVTQSVFGETPETSAFLLKFLRRQLPRRGPRRGGRRRRPPGFLFVLALGISSGFSCSLWQGDPGTLSSLQDSHSPQPHFHLHTHRLSCHLTNNWNH